MAKSPKKKTLEVQKFGGTESLGTVREEGNFDPFKSYLTDTEKIASGVNWEAQSIEAKSDTNLEQDQGSGQKVIIRCFDFAMNPDAIRYHMPTKQQLFDSHIKGIETSLWKDGLKLYLDVEPRLKIEELTGKYTIFVAAVAQKGNPIKDEANTLTQLVHGR